MHMDEVILHHYAGSPFGEKIATILGYKGVSWRSVRIPPVLPRPLLAPLVGPYRRTPVLQIGAHVYCDTRCIVRHLEEIFPERPLSSPGGALAGALMHQWVESRVFVAMGPLRFRSAGDVAGVLEQGVDAAAFAADRTPFMRGALDVARAAELAPAAWDQVRGFLRVLDCTLAASGAYLEGDRPTLADFSAYPLAWWLAKPPSVSAAFDGMPHVELWLARMSAIGHGKRAPIDGEEALERARKHAPACDVAACDDPFGRHVGSPVRIAADDYGRDVCEGELAAASDDEIVLRRGHPTVGTVLVHFPRVGFEILPR
jgi:glutathione S-transferase